jgi:nucleotide-binding universal stress UspA family protein
MAVRNILVLFDSLPIRSEAVQYAIELAKRTDCELIILMLLSSEMSEKAPLLDGTSPRVQDELLEQAENVEEADIFARAIIRTGDPQSELMKFLAGSTTTQAIVWGGRPDLLNQRRRQKKLHWLVQVKGVLEFPIVIPSMKYCAGDGRKHC